MCRQVKYRLGGALLGAVTTIAIACSASAAENGAVHRVRIERFAFVPSMLTLRPGDTVEWLNSDLVPHTATDRDGQWDTAKLVKDQTFRMTFSAVGIAEYFCAYHPHMRGRIVVTTD